MAFQGNLRDFSVSEILQLLGTQKKTGSLMLEWNAARAQFHILEGRIVSTREAGMTQDDPLLKFLTKVHRLSNEQYRGILTIQNESGRDLEDLLVNGRYVDAEELSFLLERQILDDLMRVHDWTNGSYRFDPNKRWTAPPLVRMSVEASLIEVARRSDEQKMFESLRRDPHQIVAVRDLPENDQELSQEVCDLFGIIDGHRTIAEIVAAAPLTDYEALEALHQMIEAQWIEIKGRRDPAVEALSPDLTHAAEAAEEAESDGRWIRQVVVGIAVVAVWVCLSLGGRLLHPAAAAGTDPDPYAASRLRVVRLALDLYAHQNGRYPERLEELSAGFWVDPQRLVIPGHSIVYEVRPDGLRYDLAVTRAAAK